MEGKLPAVSSMSGLVSEAFRKSNKFTQDSMIRINPNLSKMLLPQTKQHPKATLMSGHKQQHAVSQARKVQQLAALARTITSTPVAVVEDEAMSSSEGGVHSDQMTVSSPISSQIDNTTTSSAATGSYQANHTPMTM